MSGVSAGTAAWERASFAAAAFALDPLGMGATVRSGPSAARDAWLQGLRDALAPEAPIRRIPASIADDRLLGGLDIAATMASGRPVAERGVLAQTHGGVLVLAMAERIPSGTAARLAAALDTGMVASERDGIALRMPARIGFVALDEGCADDEAPPAILLERCGYFVDLSAVSAHDVKVRVGEAVVQAARARLATVIADPSVVATLVSIAAQLGIASLRAPLFALRAARAICALDGRTRIEDQDVALAAALTLAPRATRLPADVAKEAERATEPEREGVANGRDSDEQIPGKLEDVVLAAVKAAIPDALLARITVDRGSRRKSAIEAKASDRQTSTHRGRPIGARAGSTREGRLSIISTLRAAAPWQPLRRSQSTQTEWRTVIIRPQDFRIVRFSQARGTTTIFIVDASGSSAMHRLAEVKGAIELLLVDCYVRRDSVALIAFRGQNAEIILPPTRSSARARRRLAGLPGGGGTPLANGIDVGAGLADQVRRKGQSPLVVLMTDGRANVSRDGTRGRARAMDDALDAGRRLRAAGIPALAIDTSESFHRRELAATLQIAEAMRARYVKLPLADAALVNEAVRASSLQLRS